MRRDLRILTRVLQNGYSVLVRAFPRRFQDQFGSAMVQDFADGGADAAPAGWRGIVAHGGHAYADVMASLVREWARSRSAAIIGFAVCCTALLCGVLVRFAPPRHTRLAVPPPTEDELSFLLVVLALLLSVTLVILLTCWVVPRLLRRMLRPCSGGHVRVFRSER
jgi:hypothetical protein